jgi:outer membrane protein OmpA-like peptidoglycan-associated protein
MKKLFLMLAVASLSLNAMAQEDPTEKYSVSTNSFWSNWFIQTNLNWSSYTVGTHGLFSAPFRKFPMGTDRDAACQHGFTAPSLSIAVGKWFTPGLGLRTKANFGWMGKAFDSDAPILVSVNEQVLFNLHNLLGGYDESRVWNFIPFVGAGLAHTFKTPNGVSKAGTYTFSAGLLNTFKISRKVALNLEVAYANYGKELVGVSEGGIMPKHRLNQLSVEVGATFNLGKGTWSKTPDVDAIKALSQGQIDALNAQLTDAQAENARLKDMLANQQKQEAQATAVATKTVTKVVAAPVSVFFNIGKSKVASKKDLQNVSDLAKVAKENNSKIVVTGYADSKTGSASYNQTLSEKRAKTVVDELVKMGVDRNNIECVGAGGVATLSPINYNRRATVEIK